MGWNYETTVGLVVLLATWPLGFLVFASRPGHAANRLLGTILFFEGVGVAGYRLNDLAPSLEVAAGMGAVAMVAILALSPLYLAFLGVALDTPLTRPFRTPLGRFLLFAWFVASVPVTLIWTNEFVGRMMANDGGYGDGRTTAQDVVMLLYAAVALFNLVASLSTIVTSPKGTIGRRQAKAFALAFGARDVVLVPWFVYGVLTQAGGTFFATGFLLASLYPPLLAYALLRHQHFDIDLRIKWSISRGSLATVFVAVFLVASQLGEEFAQQVVGQRGWIVGGLAAGLLVFGLTPLQRLADKFANRAMPHATGSAQYVAYKKLDVYRAAVEGIARDGKITHRERASLDRLQAKLDIAKASATQVEREALQRSPTTRRTRRTAS